ncbi:hypothetical protein CCAX7_35430 [Capsulimonas corticalis]|uniref:Uncharacterized protein n=1 Tax=Capsulimonas corticalis TaxID=2219043 RepID=A0A402D6C8_9BACT|nr:hypothetical protein CCAX7_35430 [Capsulimonas corticalis]
MYKLRRGRRLILTPSVLEVFSAHIQAKGANEAGGILLGRRLEDGTVLVERATTPSPLDDAGPSFFVRSRIAAQAIIDDAWRESDGYVVYLGEWHTHAVAQPHPSAQDRKMIASMLNDSKTDTDFVLLVIVGWNELWVGCRAKNWLRRTAPITCGG